MVPLSLVDELTQTLETWFREQTGGALTPNKRYVVCAGLAILEHIKDHYPLEREHYVTQGTQVRTSGSLIQEILRRFGETREFAREGGRTTRGTLAAAESLVERLNHHPCRQQLQQLTPKQRTELMHRLQAVLVAHVRQYFDEQQRLRVEIDPSKPVSQGIKEILNEAEKKNVRGPVAQHLVGAKLALRFPDKEIENHPTTAADAPTGRPGDFLVGHTVFHVTVAPTDALFREKCRENIRNQYRVKVIVPEQRIEAARQLAENAGVHQYVEILSLEHFVGPNVEEIGEFDRDRIAAYLRRLLETYNARVEEAESSRSLLIDIPANLPG